MSKIIEFLQSIGTPAEVIAALEASDDSTDLSSLVEQTEAGVETTLNDANFANNSEIILTYTYFV
jgi:H2-forming N5,N10-methylenetetrahydromethanopterin dehydrogenase-like enzyme